MAVKSKNRLPQLMKQMAKLGKKRLQVGVFDNEKRSDSNVSNAELAIIHTYGLGNVPARPFLEPALKKHAMQYGVALEALVAKAIKEATKSGTEPDAEALLAKLAGRCIADVKQYINSNQVMPPDSAETIKRKGSDVTLVETRQLVNAIEGRIV
jgi:hypothetical protein